MIVLLSLACVTDKPEVPVTPTPTPAPVPTAVPTPTLPPANFGEFYAAFQELACEVAQDGGCDDAFAALNCDDPSTVPGCTGFDADAAELCLAREVTCDGATLETSSACALVCEDQDFSELGGYRSEICLQMIACDNALAMWVDSFTSSWPDGVDDVDYGIGGSCYDVDPVACEEACTSAYEAYQLVADVYDDNGQLNGVPIECGGSGTLPSPPTPPPFEWTVTLADGDGMPDTPGVVDADTITVRIANSLANYPSIYEWEYGYGQTAFGPATGWFGEDCDGGGSPDICHVMDPDTTMVLSRVATPGAIVSGATTLLPVEFPVSTTPGIASVLFGYDNNNVITECFVQGYQVGYYASTGCDPY